MYGKTDEISRTFHFMHDGVSFDESYQYQNKWVILPDKN
jgi:hypothetical protein